MPAQNSFIQLDRLFDELSSKENAIDDDFGSWLPTSKRITWAELRELPRVVLISEAGSGKTMEIRQLTQRLREEGRHAVFLRLEHAVHDLEEAFDVENRAAFAAWLKSADEGWLFLDSVDESRLGSHGEFERAVKRVSNAIWPRLGQTHLILTSRSEAWRPVSDLEVCEDLFPCQSPIVAVPGDGKGKADTVQTAEEKLGAPKSAFRFFSLADLTPKQIDRFLAGCGIADIARFQREVDQQDAWSFTARPQDLRELADYWTEHGRIGTRLELMENGVAQRLKERDESRLQRRNVPEVRIREGALRLAAAVTLTKQQAIQVRDGAASSPGLSAQAVLPDWKPHEISALLERPIFEPDRLGTVRFYRRPVREYLTAVWLNGLLVKHRSRSRIETLLFREQYGINVVVPTMRHVVPWLALWDTVIRSKALQVAPEVFFESGDPGGLPIEQRRSILDLACRLIAKVGGWSSIARFAAVQRFASAELADDIARLLVEYHGNEDVLGFLYTMVGAGEISHLKGSARGYALDGAARYPRLAATRAFMSLATDAEQLAFRLDIAEGAPIDRDWLAEVIRGLPPDTASIAWFVATVARVRRKKRFSVDSLARSVEKLASEWPVAHLDAMLQAARPLLATAPRLNLRSEIEETRHLWLLPAAGIAVSRLIEDDHPGWLSPAALDVMRLLPIAEQHGFYEVNDVTERLAVQVAKRADLRHALFWHCVAVQRAHDGAEKPLVEWWQVNFYRHMWSFSKSDLDIVFGWLKTKPLLDDRKVALSLAVTILKGVKKSAAGKARLVKSASDEPALAAMLEELLNPPPSTYDHKAEQKKHADQVRRAKARQSRISQEWKKKLQAEHASLSSFPAGDGVSQDQYYLVEKMRELQDPENHWAHGNWRLLIEPFGVDVAEAFRTGVVTAWRDHRPLLRSEGSPANNTGLRVICGLVGLAILAAEEPEILAGLSIDEARLVTRYAIHELNGLPDWLAAVHAKQPAAVLDVFLQEIEYELRLVAAAMSKTEHPHEETSTINRMPLGWRAVGSYVAADIGSSARYLWNPLGAWLLERYSDPATPYHGDLVEIMLRSPVSDAELSALAASRVTQGHAAVEHIWFAIWAGVSPTEAIGALEQRLEQLEPVAASEFASRFAIALLGSEQSGIDARQGFRTVTHLKSLYLLLHHHVRVKDDTTRPSGEVYSPTTRDDAQQARETLLGWIQQTPGKGAFLALMEIGAVHPVDFLRHRADSLAREKAAADADLVAWKPGQVCDFNEKVEATPATHEQLWDLACDRLEDLRNALEHGDESDFFILRDADEVRTRIYFNGRLREAAGSRYQITPESELADGTKPDLRFLGSGIDTPVPIELKIADNWTGEQLFERLENQLCGQYLRDSRSTRGVYLLVFQRSSKPAKGWKLPGGKSTKSFAALLAALRQHWASISPNYPNIVGVAVVGIDLTLRKKEPSPSTRQRRGVLANEKPVPTKQEVRKKQAVAGPKKNAITAGRNAVPSTPKKKSKSAVKRKPPLVKKGNVSAKSKANAAVKKKVGIAKTASRPPVNTKARSGPKKQVPRSNQQKAARSTSRRG